MTKIYIANVGVNRSDEKRGLMSPIFPDNTFEFIPIKEPKSYIGTNYTTYQDVKCYNTDNSLSSYIPKKIHTYRAHNDPEFVTFTYGDLIKNARSANLKNIFKGDFLFFLARLTPYREGYFLKDYGAFYFIGYFQINGIYTSEESISKNLNILKNNAHYHRYKAHFDRIGELLILKGDENNSIRFKFAIPIDKNFCDKFLKDAHGKPFDWKPEKHTINQRIGSYTRTIRNYINQNLQPELWNYFWNFINKYK